MGVQSVRRKHHEDEVRVQLLFLFLRTAQIVKVSFHTCRRKSGHFQRHFGSRAKQEHFLLISSSPFNPLPHLTQLCLTSPFSLFSPTGLRLLVQSVPDS